MCKTEMRFVHPKIDTEVKWLAVVIGQVQSTHPKLWKAGKRKDQEKENCLNYFIPQYRLHIPKLKGLQ